MRVINILFLALLLFSLGSDRELSLMAPLEDPLDETSGIFYIEGRMLSVNDSGEPIIYEIDQKSGEVTRTVEVCNATNSDWEDIAADEEYIYIGDIGNNYGVRRTLKIYRVLKSEYLNSANDSVTADEIEFNYVDNKDFSSALFSTNFDAEALISYGDNLYVFTKNWGDKRTNIYAVPKTPGTYEVEKIDSINVKGLITGATYDPVLNKIMLSGNEFPYPFVVELTDFPSGRFSEGTINKFSVQPQLGYSYQIEGITFDGNFLYMTAEKNKIGKAGLYKLKIRE